jgi:hypothetical protein
MTKQRDAEFVYGDNGAFHLKEPSSGLNLKTSNPPMINLNHLIINNTSRDEYKNNLVGSSLKKFDTVNKSNISKQREINFQKKRATNTRRVRKRSKNT